MAASFFDTSALVKCYLKEIGTNWARNLINDQPGHDIIIAQITGVEVVAAITRRLRARAISPPEAAQAISAFRSDFQSRYDVVVLSVPLIVEAMDIAELHGLRGYDAVQLATALLISKRIATPGTSPLTMVSSDNDLNIAARAEGLLTDDPNLHP